MMMLCVVHEVASAISCEAAISHSVMLIGTLAWLNCVTIRVHLAGPSSTEHDLIDSAM